MTAAMSQDPQPPLPPPAAPPVIPPPEKPPLTAGKIILRVFLGMIIAGLLLFGVCFALSR